MALTAGGCGGANEMPSDAGNGGAAIGTGGTGTGGAATGGAADRDAGPIDERIDMKSGPTDAGPGGDDQRGDGANDDATNGAPAVRFVGRFDRSDPAGPRFAWSGSGMIARFSGTSVGIKLNGAQQYTVLIDGVLKPKLLPAAGGALSPIASGLSAGEHVVEIYRRTEANQGEAQFLGFDFGGGTLLAPPPTPTRRIEMIGDSITCAYGIEGANMNCTYTEDTQDQYLAYGSIAARNAGADVVTVAWSGKGVVCNYGDDPTSCVDPLPIYYDRTLPERADSHWDFSQWQPQVVVINLGTNDFSTAVDPTPAQFSTAYQTFLQHIRSKYPTALILCTVAPLLGGSDLTTARAAIDAAVAATGDANIKSFTMDPTDPADGYGCDYHPSVKTHQKMAAVLTAKLKTELGW
ncbi:MAG TPA: SGNH/GDSL hydrolase family protein [Polyangia bacterium]|nr:SGNH/GDSL hydrolase family protein [Polyangia bacterium]